MQPYWYNPDIALVYELQYKKELLTPGRLIKIKFERSVFRFDRLVVNAKTHKEWIDVYDIKNGGWRSFTPDRIAGLYIAKKSRAKKKNG